MGKNALPPEIVDLDFLPVNSTHLYAYFLYEVTKKT